LIYDRKEGFRTAETTLPFKALGWFSGSKIEMVEPGGFEPPSASPLPLALHA